MREYKNYIATPTSLVIVYTDGTTAPVLKDNPLFNRVKDIIAKRDWSAIPAIMDAVARIKKATNGMFYTDEHGQVIHAGEVMPSALSKRVLQFVDNLIDTTSLTKFWENLVKNPSESSKRELYDFLEANDVAITEDGCFIGYRRITSDFKDFYTGKIDNSIGAKPYMDRSLCNPNRNETCSRGLHIAAFRYAKEDYHAGEGQLIEVKVNPEDVVTVPPDYNQMKMRVCRYEVLSVIEKQRKNLTYPKFAVDQTVLIDDNGTERDGTIISINAETPSPEYQVRMENGLIRTFVEHLVSDPFEGDTEDQMDMTEDEDDMEDVDDDSDTEPMDEDELDPELPPLGRPYDPVEESVEDKVATLKQNFQALEAKVEKLGEAMETGISDILKKLDNE